ncbi:MAG: putative aminohydrolase SsnA [Calditrichaceae bacterium]|nr:putative aminohydrolase SsnA [Calditrichaceae bacterium]HES59180.1 putative aminohydrolase SsnA [Caldithrix sp.]
MGTLIHNVRIFTNNSYSQIIEDGAVYFENRKIIATDLSPDLLNKYPESEKMDGQGKLLMPGWINAHMHCYSAYARGLAMQQSPQNFYEILKQLWWRLDKALDAEANYYSALLQAIAAVKNGVTTLIDHHASPNCIDGSLDRIEEALAKVGLRASLCYEVSDRDGEEKSKMGMAENIRYIRKCQDAAASENGLYSALFGLHASFTLSDQTLICAAEFNNHMKSGFHIHLAEGSDDNDLKIHGIRAAERLKKFGILGNKTIAVHGIHLTGDEMDMIADSGTMIIHNPQSNMNNAVGRTNIFKMMKKNILVGLGSDGMNASLYPEMRSANLIHKHDLKDSNAGWNEVQQIVLENNAEIYQRIAGQKIGQITPGHLADLILIDYFPPTELTSENIWGHILFGIADAQVDTTIINGRIVMQNKQIIGIDEEEIAAKSREFANRIWRKF